MNRALGFVAVLALAIASEYLVSDFPELERSAFRDRVQSQAEAAERGGHPWAGVYISAEGPWPKKEAVLVLSPDSDYFGRAYQKYQADSNPPIRGRLVVSNGRIALQPRGGLPPRASGPFFGSYRLVKWGGIRCLIRPDEGARFLDCAARRCEDYRPFCSRGVVFRDPDLPEELAEARKSHPFFKSFRIKSLSGPHPETWGRSYRVELEGGIRDGLTNSSLLYWGDRRALIRIEEAGETTSTGTVEIATDRQEPLSPPLAPGMKVYRWILGSGSLPRFLQGIAQVKE